MRSLEGLFSKRINDLLAQVVELRVYVEAAIDFPEEEIDFLKDDRVSERLNAIASTFVKLLDSATEGALLTEGASVVLIGKPNVGKSSLMNLMTGRDTSIVTDIPGTTRDVVNETLQLDGIPLRLVDTAGIRETEDVIESEGVRRAVRATEQADLVIAMADATSDSWQVDLAELKRQAPDRAVLVCNKTDLLDEPSETFRLYAEDILPLSVKTGAGVEQLKARLKENLGVSSALESGFTARRRHLEALRRGSEAVRRGSEQLAMQQAGELLAEELKVCQQCLSEITGEYTADDLLGEIFSSFCIGK
jgi:tRNA modification GTPase